MKNFAGAIPLHEFLQRFMHGEMPYYDKKRRRMSKSHTLTEKCIAALKKLKEEGKIE